MKKKVFLIVGILLLFSNMYAQSVQDNVLIVGDNEQFKPIAKPGTFQLVFASASADPIFLSKEILVLIESKRSQSETVTFQLTADIKVIIPSKTVVQDPSYVPFQEEFILETH